MKPVPSRPRDVDHHVGRRMRELRLMLGMSQQALAARIGVTSQQAHNYENGVARIAAGRLYGIAQMLGVDVGYFYDVGGGDGPAPRSMARQRRQLQLSRSFLAITSAWKQRAICDLAGALAERQPVQDDEGGRP
jgi:transcriptional regulator with XRE-family HTH domain